MPILNRPSSSSSSSGELEGIEYSGTAQSNIKKNELCILAFESNNSSNLKNNAKQFGDWILDWIQIDEDTIVFLDAVWDKSPSIGDGDNYNTSIYIATINRGEDRIENPLINITGKTINISSASEVALVKLNVPNKTIILVKLDNYLFFYEITSSNQLLYQFSITYSEYPTTRAYERRSFRQIVPVNYDGYINDGTFYDFYEYRNNIDSNIFSIDYCKVIITTKEFSRERVLEDGMKYYNEPFGLITPINRASNIYYLFSYGKETVSGEIRTNVALTKLTVPKIGEANLISPVTIRSTYMFGDLYAFTYDINDTIIMFHATGNKSSNTDTKIAYIYVWSYQIFPNYNLSTTLIDINYTIKLLYNYSSINSFSASGQLMCGNTYVYLFSYIGVNNNKYMYVFTYNLNKYTAYVNLINSSVNQYVSPLKPFVVDDCVYYLLESPTEHNYNGYIKIITNHYFLYLLNDVLYSSSKYTGLAKDNYAKGETATIIHPTTK